MALGGVPYAGMCFLFSRYITEESLIRSQISGQLLYFNYEYQCFGRLKKEMSAFGKL